VLLERQHDIKPTIRIAKSDFKIFAKDKARLTRETFVSMMREQLYAYIQSRLSSKSEFWNDAPYEFNSIGPLKYLMMELIRTKQQTEQPAADVASTTQGTESIQVYSGLTPSAAACGSAASGGSTGSAAEICAIGELVLQLGRAAGEGDMTRQIAAISGRLQRLVGGARAEQDKRQEGNGASSPVIFSCSSSSRSNRAAASGRSASESPVLARHRQRDQRSSASTPLLGSAAHKAKPGPPGPGGPPARDPHGDGPAAGGDRSESSVSPRRMEDSGTGLVSPVRIHSPNWEAHPGPHIRVPAGMLAGWSGSLSRASESLRYSAPRRTVTTPPQALLHRDGRRFQSEGGASGSRGSRPGNPNSSAGPSGHSASSLHYQGWPNDIVLVSGVGSPVGQVGRSSVGSIAAVRSTWIEPTLL
jgi:hypothetical protein